jgi:hypothetical protein
MEMNGRSYQNIILTVIAVLLLVLVAQTPSRIGLATAAYAQNPVATTTRVNPKATLEGEAEMARQLGEIAKAIEAMPKPEVAYYPEPEREEEPEEVPKPIMVQRKDGMISGVKVGEVAYDVVRNKAGLIKEVRPRA